METSALLAPPAVLVAWSLIMLLWLVTTRLPAFKRAGMSLSEAPRGARYADVEKDMPAGVNWISHNYTHLMEQPTIFYAVVFVLVLAGDNSAVSLGFAWGYVGIRILHSLWQALVNTVLIRITLFTLSTVCLLVLSIQALRVSLG